MIHHSSFTTSGLRIWPLWFLLLIGCLVTIGGWWWWAWWHSRLRRRMLLIHPRWCSMLISRLVCACGWGRHSRLIRRRVLMICS